MNLAIGILTHNVLSTLRVELLRSCLQTIGEAFPSSKKVVLDNGSNDGSLELLCDAVPHGFRLERYVPADGNTTPGRGVKQVARALRGMLGNDDVAVFSDDDMEWRTGAEQKLRELWRNAPDDLVIVSGLLEPVWSHNTPRSTIDCGSVRVLVRDSCPAAAWTMRATSLPVVIGCDDTFEFDTALCTAIRETISPRAVAQVDLARQRPGFSSHDNEPMARNDTRPLDRAKWGM